jgi:hypothetical protein
MFEWAAFISASKDLNTALDYRGTVLFDITPGGSYSMHGKRDPYDIAAHSTFPGEQEVVFPIAWYLPGNKHQERRSPISDQLGDRRPVLTPDQSGRSVHSAESLIHARKNDPR